MAGDAITVSSVMWVECDEMDTRTQDNFVPAVLVLECGEMDTRIQDIFVPAVLVCHDICLGCQHQNV